MVFNKTVADGCSKRRPDVLINLPTHNIIVEIDENQHTMYGSTCEEKRVHQLFEDLDHMPLIMIRFNPDKYLIGENRIKGAFKIHRGN